MSTGCQNLVAFIFLALAFSGLSVLASTVPQSISTAHPSSRNLSPAQVHKTIYLNGSIQGWNLTRPGPSISVDSGDLVSLMLKGADGIAHRWYIDFNNNTSLDSDEPFVSPTFSSAYTYTNYTFTPVIGTNVTHAGSWEYRCVFHQTFMYGIISVSGNASPSSSGGIPDPLLIGGGLIALVAAVTIGVIVLRRRRVNAQR